MPHSPTLPLHAQTNRVRSCYIIHVISCCIIHVISCCIIHVISCCIMLHHDTMLHDVTPCNIMLQHVTTRCLIMLHPATLHHVTPCYIMLHHITACCIMLQAHDNVLWGDLDGLGNVDGGHLELLGEAKLAVGLKVLLPKHVVGLLERGLVDTGGHLRSFNIFLQ